MILEADERVVSDDDVIDHIEAKQAAGPHETLGHLEIVAAGLRIA
jgi:hypothetical protein